MGIERRRETEREQQAAEKERGLLPEQTSKLCLDVDVEWALMVSEGKRLHRKKKKKERKEKK